MATTEAQRAEAAGDLVNLAENHVKDALVALDMAREQVQGTSITHVIRVVRDPSTRSLTPRDLAIATTELEGVLLRLKHGTPER